MRSEFQNLFQRSDRDMFQGLYRKLDHATVENLSQLEKEICVLIWMNFDQYEIAQLLSMEVADVEMEKERIRDKLAIRGDETIQIYMNTFLV